MESLQTFVPFISTVTNPCLGLWEVLVTLPMSHELITPWIKRICYLIRIHLIPVPNCLLPTSLRRDKYLDFVKLNLGFCRNGNRSQ